MTDFIFLNSHPEAGKDTLANEIMKWDFTNKVGNAKIVTPLVFHEKFAAHLTHVLIAIYNLYDLGDQGLRYLEENKSNPTHKYLDRLMGRTWREAKIHTSESVLKPAYGEAYFGDIIATKILAGVYDHYDYVVFSDSGFSFELNPVVKAIADPSKIHVVKFDRNIDGEQMYDDTHFYYFDNQGVKKKDSRYFVNIDEVNNGVEDKFKLSEERNVQRIGITEYETPAITASRILNWIWSKK